VSAPIVFGQIAIDCETADRLAGFYSALLDRPIGPNASEFYAYIPGSTEPHYFPALLFLKVPEPKSAKNRLHLDLHSTDRDAAVARALELGARRVGEFDEWDTQWTTLADPEGNVFDLGVAKGQLGD
jgi:catechol-2,3-dioxygenase